MTRLLNRIGKASRTFSLLMIALLAAAPTGGAAASSAHSTNPPVRLNLQTTPINRDVRAGASYSAVARKVAPSVVNISSTTVIRERTFDDSILRRFFGEEALRIPRERKATGLGSGVIVTPDGYILTANHVVEEADSIKVTVGDQDYTARIIGTDAPTDVAVLKVDVQKPLPAIAIADSDQLEVGDVVLAIGNPFGLGQTVTMGIISALERGGLGITAYENFIQTDAAINTGNSGGPLVDTEGRLVGIATAILSRTGGFQGVGLAVPVNMARNVMSQLIDHGKVTRGYLGINIQPLTRELAKAFNLPDESSGVLVGGFSPNSSAQKAGVKEGDIIVAFNGKKVPDPRTLQLLVSQTPPGTKFTVRVLRSEPGRRAAERALSATLGELPEDIFGLPGTRNPPGPKSQPQSEVLDGVRITDLDARMRRQYEIPNSVRGALVLEVEPGSNAAEAELRPGDVIVEVNREPVQSADQVLALSSKSEGAQVLLRVWSSAGGPSGGTRFVAVENKQRR